MNRIKLSGQYLHLVATCSIIIFLLVMQGCTATHTFPKIARAGDTISLMVAGSENARTNTTDVVLEDANGGVHDLQASGLVRSVFNLRADGKASGAHYSPYLEMYFSWNEGHDPVQTVLVTDLPASLPSGIATLTVDPNVGDNASGVSLPAEFKLEIIPGTGNQDTFTRQPGSDPADFDRLEPAPYAKLSFGTSYDEIIGAAELIVDFDETFVNPDDINIFVPQANVRGNYSDPGAFGDNQRMVYWHQDGDKLYIDVIAPQGIKAVFLKLYAIHPDGIDGSPNFQITTSNIYDIDGNPISLTPTLTYMP